MIAVIGAAKTAVKIKMKIPDNPEAGADAGMGTYVEAGANVIPSIPDKQPNEKPQDDIASANIGCGFNIAKHLVAMGRETAFISVVGNDPLGLAAIAESEAAGVDVSGIKTIDGTTPISVEMVNILGDTELYRSNDSLLQSITPQVIEESAGILQRAQVIVLDGFLPQKTIEYVAGEYGGREDVKVYFDPASRAGSHKVENVLDKLHGVMPGRMEAEIMTDKTILSEDQLMEAGAYFHQKGVSKTIITIKGGGLYYKEGMSEGILRPQRVLSFASTSGAGDIVTAAVVAATLDGKSIEEIGKYAMDMAAAFLAECTDERIIDKRRI